ncbi:hypothetical protein CEP52_015437 [Fusarium oligoseptatum]|uniref:Uncharacterized protein n=1 Tax=Fusarium oligoseptatum TaxID=2604345 RepID=A0A428SDA1_9HYPO|nr:hypothetical protein CEP52_015437 [Fusarium oligoseptatum]
MPDKVEFDQIERVSTQPVFTKRERVLIHLKKFWWMYLLGLVCIIVLVVPLIIFVGLPNIAQSKLNSAKFGIDSITLSNMREQSIKMAFNSTIRLSGTGGIKASIDPFTAAMYLQDVQPHIPFAYIDIPKTAAKSLATVNITQDVKIPNMEAFTVFSGWLLGKKSIAITMEGKTAFKASGISKHFGVSFAKTLDLQAINGFKGLEVTSATISMKPDTQGDNLHGLDIREILKKDLGMELSCGKS